MPKKAHTTLPCPDSLKRGCPGVVNPTLGWLSSPRQPSRNIPFHFQSPLIPFVYLFLSRLSDAFRVPLLRHRLHPRRSHPDPHHHLHRLRRPLLHLSRRHRTSKDWNSYPRPHGRGGNGTDQTISSWLVDRAENVRTSQWDGNLRRDGRLWI